MATSNRKTDPKTDDKSDTTKADDKAAAADTETGDQDRSPYAKAAGDLADRVTKIVEDTRARLAEVLEDVDGVQADQEPTAADSQIADAVRRIPMSTGDVHDALDALRHAAADVARRAVS